MITEDYVSFGTAKLLKEKGFDINTLMVYSQNGNFMPDGVIEDTYQVFYAAPTLQMVMKWLREVHGLFIRITEDMTGNVFEWSVYQKNYGCRASTYIEDSYEKACETAIKYCLEKLI